MAPPAEVNENDIDEEDPSRRDFLYLTAGAMGAVGACCAAYPLIQSMQPAADTLAVSTTDVDVSSVKEGQAITVMWQGQPVFIRNRTQTEINEARNVDVKTLKDQDAAHLLTDEARVAQSNFDGNKMPNWLVVVGVCTHLGCIPLGQKPTDPKGNFDGWFCPCHGSQYDSSGRIRQGPAPSNLTVPPYMFTDATHITIGKSAEKKAG